ncbi:C2HC5 finger protein [Diplocarpon rosae]|nr:C2HC5 finger protein [Diplocarpon rosae]
MSLQKLSKLLSLPEEDLQQVLDYAATLSKQEAADHFNNLLGESPQSIEFISSFNSRRLDPTSKSSSTASPPPAESSSVPKVSRKHPKKKANLHALPARKVDNNYVAPGTAYTKKDEDDYMTRKPNSGTSTPNNAFSLDPKPVAIQAPRSKPPPSASGSLISDLKSKSTPNTRTSSPAPSSSKSTKVNITGGTSMHGASTKPAAFAASKDVAMSPAEAAAKEHRDSARPEYEKRRQVVSIDLVKGKVVKKMAAVEKPLFQHVHSESEEEETGDHPLAEVSGNAGSGKGTFSKNPLLKGLIKPVWAGSGTGRGKEVEGEPVVKIKTWSRVQDSLDDNEDVILDGGAYGGRAADRGETDEPAGS